MSYIEKFIIARWAYAIGIDYISDVEYDHLAQMCKDNDVCWDYLERGWSEDPCPYDLLKKHNLEEMIVPAVFSYRTESIDSLNNEELVEDRFRSLNTKSRLSMKLDGYSIRLNYYNGRFMYAETRNRNEKSSMNLDSIKFLFKGEFNQMLKGKTLVNGELYLLSSKFEEYKQLRNIISQRNGVSTAIANGDISFLGYRCYNLYSDDKSIDCDKYKVLQQLGFKVPKNFIISNYAELLKAINLLGRYKDSYDAPTDGLVLENDFTQIALRVGEWAEQSNCSYVTGYKVNRTMYYNSILVQIKPIFVNYKTVSEIAVTNLQNIIDNNLRIGYPIGFVERSSTNSVVDTTLTADLQRKWFGRYNEYCRFIDEKGE